MSNNEQWLKICARDDIPRLGARVVKREGRCDIALFRTGEDAVFALNDRCPHRGGPLSQGIVHGNAVACPLHGWNIGLADGQAVAPDEGCTQRYRVREEGGDIYLRSDELLAADAPVVATACPAELTT